MAARPLLQLLVGLAAVLRPAYGLAVSIRPAVLTDKADAAALCDVRAPTQYVVEDGGVGFMGQKVELSAEEAFERRVQARLGSALVDKAQVLIAFDEDSAAATEGASPPRVIGTVDCVELPAGKGRRALAPELPRRFLIRNLWVEESCRRQGLARRLMAAAEELAAGQDIRCVTLEVNAENAAARALYESLGYEDLEPTPVPLPAFLKSAYYLGKNL